MLLPLALLNMRSLVRYNTSTAVKEIVTRLTMPDTYVYYTRLVKLVYFVCAVTGYLLLMP